MKPLSIADMERFGWDKVSPGIYDNIKKKKRKILLLRIITFSILPILIGTGMWMGSFDDSSAALDTSSTIDQTAYIDQESAFIVNENIASGLVEEIKNGTTTENSHGSFEEKSIELKAAKNSGNSDKNTTGQELKKIYEFIDQPLDAPSQIMDQPNLAVNINRINQIGIPKTIGSNQLKYKVTLDSLKAACSCDCKHRRKCHCKIPKDTLPPVIAVKAIELAYNTNMMLEHPHSSMIGHGVKFGYVNKLKGPHYYGFNFVYQEYRYKYSYPIGIVNLNNKEPIVNYHNLFSVPIFYGYQLRKKKIGVSIESGINIALIKFSKGEIGSPANSNVVLRISEENYFRNNIGGSWMARAKVSYPIYKNLECFTTVGAQLFFRNWYIDDSYIIKPILANVNLGVRRVF